MTHPLLAEVLALPSSGSATNFYLDASDVGAPFATSAAQRRASLEAHLNDVWTGDVLLVGEAAGWRGARQSGVPFTSCTTLGLPGPREASATVVRGTLAALGVQRRVLLWNAFPLHPHNPSLPESNRAPTTAELMSGEAALRVAASDRRVVCVGGKAATSVARVIGAPVAVASARARVVAVRHPSFGGANQFRAEMHAIAKAWGW